MLTLVNFTGDFYSEAAVLQSVREKIKHGEFIKTVDCGYYQFIV